MSADLQTQIGIRSALVASSAVTALVPATSILDRNERPAPRPSIIIGECQSVDERNSIDRTRTRVFHTLHIWTTELSTETNKQITGAIKAALGAGRLDLGTDYHAADAHVSSTRHMRDPDGESAHGVMVIDILAQEVSP